MVIARGEFLAGLGALVVGTGGLDPCVSPSPPAGGTTMRVLLGEGRDLPTPAPDGTFAYAGRRWRGTPSVVALDGGRSGIVSTLELDRYLAGVVPLEAAAGWPAAALEAQAIVARTYALARRTLSRPWDLSTTQSDQRWGGVEAEHPATTAAVLATRGRIVTWRGGPASVFYSACCGGRTEDAGEVWGRTALPYLRAVDDPHCVDAPDYRWRRDVALDRLAGALGASASGCGPLAGFELEDPDGGGRPRRIALVGRDGRAEVPTARFRALVGADVVRSPWITGLRVDGAQAPPRVVIEGAGRGHGVGLCQWGARAMAHDGADAAAILAFYFPGTVSDGGR